MKILLRTGLALSLFFTALGPARAQAVANGDFETWAARSSVDSPTNWLTTDDVIAALAPFRLATGTFTKVTDAHGGTYALRLETKATLLGPVVPGAVLLGSKLVSSGDTPGGLPFTGRPAVLQFYYKLTGPQPAKASDGAFAAVVLTRTINGHAETIATADQEFTAVTPAYALARLRLTYTSAATPDSVHVGFGSSLIDISTGLPTGGTVGTVFQVDDVVLTGTATATRDAALDAALTVAPNPSAGRYLLRAAPALLAAPLAVVDATGRVVRREAAPAPAATRALDLSGLAGGVYTLQLFTSQGLITKKLVVQ